MNELRKSLKEQTLFAEQKEKARVDADSNRLKFHLMPQVGWMNDPNGLCQFGGVYHVFYQYSPLDVEGGMKAWGHKTSRDLIHWKQEPTEFFPDMPFDKDGVYSGSACIAQNKMYLFYTGNVKQEGDHDFDYTGREANTVLISSSDGTHFSEKELLMTNRDYPSDYTCHIRDPKVWQENGKFYMVQGGRKNGKLRDQEDYGTILLFESENLHHWEFVKELTTKDMFGFMWECPDYFLLDGQPILSFSPQGIAAEEYRFQNVYQSGYLLMDRKITEEFQDSASDDSVKVIANELPDHTSYAGKHVEYVDASGFREWDMGFDFYAPQTFQDEKGRRIIIGWAGIGDADYDNEPTIKCGWQHALTMPRELTLKNGIIYQQPVEELKELRKGYRQISEGETVQLNQTFFELIVERDAQIQTEKNISDVENVNQEGFSPAGGHASESVHKNQQNAMDNNVKLTLSCGKEEVNVRYEAGVLSLSMTKEAGRGRTIRKMRLDSLDKLHLYVDTSLLELYVNDGEAVFTTRYYFPEGERELSVSGMRNNTLFQLDQMEENE